MTKKYLFTGVLVVACLVGSVATTRLVRGMPKAIEIEPSKVSGDPDAKVFILEYSDFACPYCSGIVPILNEVSKAYPKDFKILFKHYPLDMHPSARPAAEAAECAADQGKFWEYHDLLFQKQQEWVRSKDLAGQFTAYAGTLGLNQTRFRQCLDTHAKKAIVDKNKAEGRKFFVGGTPTLILNGRRNVFFYKPEDLKKMIGDEIAKAQKR